MLIWAKTNIIVEPKTASTKQNTILGGRHRS